MSDNINYFTDGRFNPIGQLNEKADCNYIEQNNSHALPFIRPKRIEFRNIDNLGIILNKNDLSLNYIFENMKTTYECCVYSIEHENKLVNEFNNNILQDIMKNNNSFEITENFNQIFDWLTNKKIKNLILPYETVGNKIFNVEKFKNKLKKLNIQYSFFLRDWDSNAFPHATKGFFKFKKNIPNLLNLVDI
jgi:deoxyribodipyrimidine photo-lyase